MNEYDKALETIAIFLMKFNEALSQRVLEMMDKTEDKDNEKDEYED